MNFKLHEKLRMEPGKWIPVELTFDPVNDSIHVDINGLKQTVAYNFEKPTGYRLFFGSNSYKEFATSDVPPVTIKEIRIFNHQQKPVYNWKLDKHAKTVVYDEYKQAQATVVNPIWEIDAYTKWKKIKSFRFPYHNLSFPQITWDKYGKRFFFVDLNSIYTYRVEADILDTVIPLSGAPYPVEINQLHYNRQRDELVFYEFTENNLNFFNLQTKQWSQYRANSYQPRYMQHSSYYDEATDAIYTLGGYGYYRYSSLLQIHNDSQWSQHDLSDKIHPRYLASMGIYKDSLFIYFGGYGNESGRQQESPRNYYDLYAINRTGLHVTKLWELEKTDESYLNSNALICNEESDLFYVLTFFNNKYETSALLHEYRINEPSYRVIGDTIPFYFNDIQSFCNLYKPEDESCIYAITSYVKNGEREISVYSIAYPPLSLADTIQVAEQESSGNLFIVFILALAGLFGVFFISRRYGKRNKRKQAQLKKRFMEEPAELVVEEQPVFPAIYMLGDLSIIDSNNENIVSQLTSTTKKLFLMLLLHTINRKKGVSSVELQHLIWQDKDHLRARNNRNVFMSKLRRLVGRINGATIQVENEQYIIRFDNEVYIDYEAVKSAIKKMNRSASVDRQELDILLKTIKRGRLLLFHEYEWLDEYKSEYADSVIEFLYDLCEKPDIKNDNYLRSCIADAILVQDNIDEKGIKIKCNALVKLGKQNQAIQVFKKYCDDYKKLLGEKTKISFENFFDL